MNMIETYRGVVYPEQLDHMGHMNVKWYTSKFDEAGWQLCSAIGITSEYMREKSRGMVALEQFTKYKSEVKAGELLVVKSRVPKVSNKTITYLHIMYNAESMQEVASTELLALQIDTKTRKSCPLPKDVIEKCAELFDVAP
jgi:acyl-CoA thioester hydrolase